MVVTSLSFLLARKLLHDWLWLTIGRAPTRGREFWPRACVLMREPVCVYISIGASIISISMRVVVIVVFIIIIIIIVIVVITITIINAIAIAIINAMTIL